MKIEKLDVRVPVDVWVSMGEPFAPLAGIYSIYLLLFILFIDILLTVLSFDCFVVQYCSVIYIQPYIYIFF